MRRDVQEIFRSTPTQKQVMMFSATLSDEIKPICKKFMQNPTEHYVDEDTKLTLHGLQQYYIPLEEREKNRKLNELLDILEFNQVCSRRGSHVKYATRNSLLTGSSSSSSLWRVPSSLTSSLSPATFSHHLINL